MFGGGRDCTVGALIRMKQRNIGGMLGLLGLRELQERQEAGEFKQGLGPLVLMIELERAAVAVEGTVKAMLIRKIGANLERGIYG